MADQAAKKITPTKADLLGILHPSTRNNTKEMNST